MQGFSCEGFSRILANKPTCLTFIFGHLLTNQLAKVLHEGFDRNDEIRKNISTYHKEILTQINKELNEVEESDEEDRSSDESYGDAWLAKFDDNGELIG